MSLLRSSFGDCGFAKLTEVTFTAQDSLRRKNYNIN